MMLKPGLGKSAEKRAENGPALGRGLGDLMHGDQVARKDQSPAPEIQKQKAPGFGRGMQALVRQEPSTSHENAAAKRPILPAWFYFAADIVLLAYAVGITLAAPRPFDFATIAFCAVSVTVAGLLGIFGLLQAISERARDEDSLKLRNASRLSNRPTLFG